MPRKLHAKLDSGLDLTLRVISTLRRKEFEINNIEMISEDSGGQASLFITLSDNEKKNVESAVYQMEKIYGVNEITVV
ncbi:MAG: ACT domain-containing protein [Acidaminobacteraceae bacterium]